MKVCTKKYDNPSIFVKVMAKKSVALFYLDTVYEGNAVTTTVART